MITPLIKKSLVRKSPVVNGLLVKGGSSGGWSGKPADWSDICKDCPANSIALYAGQGSIYTKVGNPTIENGIVSNFSGSDFIKISAFNRSSFKQIFKIRTNSSFVAYAGLWQENASTAYKSKIFFSNTGKVIINLSSNGSSFDIANNLTSTVELQTETNYYILFAYENGEYSLKYSSDGENFNNLITPIVSASVLREQESIIGYNSSNNRAFNGEFDLNESYNEVNGQYLVSTQYDNLGFTATCTGGYNVFIDGTQHGTTYASGATCTITWSTSGITTGDIITTPELLKAHKIWIEPATEGNDITAFHCARVAASGSETQCLLWVHFNIKNAIECEYTYNRYGYYANKNILAITALNNILRLSKFYLAFYGITSLEYVPILDLQNKKNSFESIFESDTNITNITFKNVEVTSLSRAFNNTQNLKKIKTNNLVVKATSVNVAFSNSGIEDISSLNIDWTNVTNANDFIVIDTNLKNTILDTSAATGLTKIGCYGNSSYFMSGFKGLRVSNEAPFSGTAPQINVSYTGMDRQALVTLFNDLPTVSDGQIINVTGSTGSENLTDEDISIAENKGWTVAGGPAFQVYATYSGASVGDTIKLNDGMATSDKNWSAYPSDTAITGDFTQTATVTAVEENNIIECAKPSIDNKTSTITTDEDAGIEVIDNTTIQSVTITTAQTATIETSANITTSNNDNVVSGADWHLFNLTAPQNMTTYIQSSGIEFTPLNMPLLLKNGVGVGLLLKNGNNVYYRNTWIINRDYDLHYQQINFSYPSGATVTCKVNNVLQNDLTPYCYVGDTITWSCDNAGTVTTGSYTVQYSSKDGNIQTITIS